MATERITLNPILEDTSNAPLDIASGNGLKVIEVSWPNWEREFQLASSADTEGEVPVARRYKNGVVGGKLLAYEPGEAATTNLVTNPKCAVDTSGWTNAGLTSMTRIELPYSAASTRPTEGADTALRCVGNGNLDRAYTQVSVTNGITYTFSAWVYLDSLISANGVYLAIANASSVIKGTSSTLSVLDEWTRLDVTVTADATGSWLFAGLQSGAGSTNFFLTACLVETAASATTYFDGDTPGCTWSSSTNGSASNRPGSDSRFQQIIQDLESTAALITAETGTLRREAARTQDDIRLDLVDAEFAIPTDINYALNKHVEIPFKFTCRPFFRGPEVTESDSVETSDPVITQTYTGITGDIPGLGRLTIDEDQAVDQYHLLWGLRSRYYDSASTAALFVEAEDLTPLGTSTAATRSGASGGISNVIRNTSLIPQWQQLLSTQLVSGGAHLTHEGRYRVWARVYDSNAALNQVELRLEWSTGDFSKLTVNDPVSPSVLNDFCLVDLGEINIEKEVTGTHQWRGRIQGKSSVSGDDIDIDYLFLIPVNEGAGEAITRSIAETVTDIVAHDEFEQTAGNLTGKAAPQGGTWQGAGDAGDMVVDATNNWVERNVESDADAYTGRYCYLDGANYTDVTTQVKFWRDIHQAGQILYDGVFARWVDANNWFMALFYKSGGSGNYWFYVWKRVAGSVTTLFSEDALSTYSTGYLRLTIDADGNWTVWWWDRTIGPTPPSTAAASGQDSDLATGGALETGRVGIYDADTGSGVDVKRYFDDFVVSTPTDTIWTSVLNASQSLEIRHDRVIHEDSGGTMWTPAPKYEGDYLYVPPAGREGRTAEVIVKASRGDQNNFGDSGIDDISMVLNYQPRYLSLPEP